jgi:hypothetical protein
MIKFLLTVLLKLHKNDQINKKFVFLLANKLSSLHITVYVKDMKVWTRAIKLV